MNPPSMQRTYKNRVLASLPEADINRLAPCLSPVTLKVNRALYEPGTPVETMYFPEEGVCSIVVTMESGSTVEVGITGRDGFVGVPAVLGSGHSPNRSYMQIPGHGFSIKTKVLLEMAEQSTELKASLLRAVQGLLIQTAQTAACNRVHELDERLARWLLMCHERVQAKNIPVTHEFLGMMLGTRRTSVTVAAGTLHQAGLISYNRGNVTIENYEGLKGAACECYRVIHEEYVRLGLL